MNSFLSVCEYDNGLVGMGVTHAARLRLFAALNARIIMMHTTMNAAPMFIDFHGLVMPVSAPRAANAYGGINEPTELPKNAYEVACAEIVGSVC